MPDEVLVKCENVSKKFCRSLKRSLLYGVQDICSEFNMFHRKQDVLGTEYLPRLRKDEFWSLSNISFEVKRGEMLGLIGQNGAGKSTLLKLVNGLIKPDKGKITIRGEIQALIELGAGFNPVLSGKENVYINAAILGISKKQVDIALPYIVEFSGLDQFIDAPVGKYSSGMKARLGFAIVTQLDPDILLIDEVLAVGDVAFQEKCMRRMDALRNDNKAIVFVTHSLYQVEALCNRALWVEEGNIVRYGNAGDIVRAYLDNQEKKSMAEASKEGLAYQGRVTRATKAYFNERDDVNEEKSDIKQPDKSQLLSINKFELIDSSDNIRNEFPFGSDLKVKIYYHAFQKIERPLFNMRFLHKGKGVFETSMLIDGHGPEWIEGTGMVECYIPALPLTPKVYEILLFVRSGEGSADIINMRIIAQFRITDDQIGRIPMRGPMALNHLRQGSPVYLPRFWTFYNDKKEICSLESTMDQVK